jgi:ribonucleoside-triphosphate reductase
MQVRNSHDECGPFRKQKIIDSLIKELELKESEARKIARSVKNRIDQLSVNIVGTDEIRVMVFDQLAKRNKMEEAREYKTVGVPVAEIKDLIRHHHTDNANLQRNPETVHKYVADSAMKQYALMCLPEDISKAHNQGDIHCLSGEMLIIYKINSAIYIKPIKDFVEGYFFIKEKVLVPSFDPETKEILWQEVVNVMKNDPQQLYKMSFRRGRSIVCTEDHPFFKANGQFLKKDPVQLKDLRPGLKILDICRIPIDCQRETSRGNLIGMFLGDGGVQGNKINFKFKKEDKTNYLINVLKSLGIEYDIEQYDDGVISIRFVDSELLELHKKGKVLDFFDEEDALGIFGGLINSDGHIRLHGSNKIPYLEFDNTNKHISDLYGALLLTQGINSSQRQYKKGENHKNVFRHIASGKRVTKLLKDISLRKRFEKIVSREFNHGKKVERDTYQLSIINIEKDRIDNTYDITVDGTHNFLAGNSFILTSNCHDLDYFAPRPLNCCQHDLRWFAREGLKVDGTGQGTSVAGPAKNIETLVNHAGELLLAGQQNMSGGQSLSLLNVFMAPFVKGLDYNRIKQAMQMLIFNLNMAYSNRGGQVPFSSVGLEFGVPKFLQDEIAWGIGGNKVGVYGDYMDETRLLNKAFIEVMLGGDYYGKPHLFPNSIWSLRKEFFTSEFEEEYDLVHQLSAKYSTPYFINQETDYNGVNSNRMGCRTSLTTTWTGDWDKDTLRTGNLAYISLNLPRMAYKENFFEELEEKLNLAEHCLLIRREHGLKCLEEYNLLPFLGQTNKEGERYYRIENTTLSFGIVGLNEALLALGIEKGIVSKEGQKEGQKILKYINNYAKDLKAETDYRWTVLQTPGETTAHRFATLDKQYYKDKAIVNGKKGGYYYTNSSHVPVNSDIILPKRIKIESDTHPLTTGGHIFHAFMGESRPNVEGLKSLTRKIVQKSDLGFWAYSNAYSFCFKCNHLLEGLQEKCVFCGSTEDVEHYDRITGYVQAVGHKKNATGGWNAGKKAELKDRYRYEV